jgi:single-strand DNA-binding protein
MSYQKLLIVGNLGRDPELSYLTSGQAVCNLSVAANRRWTDRDSGEPQEEVAWFRVSVWGKQAEAANQYLSKGRQVLVEGRLRPDPSTGGPHIYARQDGTAGASFEVVADRVQFLGGNGNGNGNNDDSKAVEPNYTEQEIPF